jgi:phage terminase large subunit
VKSESKYIKTARAAGCPPEQIARFIASNYVATPKQLQFHARCREADTGSTQVGFGGARGPGKSHAMLAQIALDDCQRLPGCRALLLRKVGKAVRESFEGLRRSVLRVPHEYRRSDGTISFPNGSNIILGHFKNEADVDNYLGLEYDVIGIEEATTLTLSKYKTIRTCARTSKPNWAPRVYANANPGGIGHAWFKARFVRGDCPFVGALVTDNPFINEGYVENLDDLTGWLKRAWRWGDWDIAAGQYFTTWRQHHVIPNEPVNKWWEIGVAMDYGFTHPTAVLLLARANEDVVYVIDEYLQAKRLVPDHVTAIREMLERHGITEERVHWWVAGQDAFNKRSTALGSVVNEYKREGITWRRAKMDRISGALEILRRLGDEENGIRSTIRIMERCAKLIETIPSMQADPDRGGEDVLKVDIDQDGNGGDDLYDAARYALQKWRRPPTKKAVLRI